MINKKKAAVAALNALSLINSLSIAAYPSGASAQGGIVKQGTIPWLIDCNVAAALCSAINAPIPTQPSTTSIGGVGILQGGAALSSTNPIFFRQSDSVNTATLDPCQVVAKTFTNINVTIATTTLLVSAAASKRVYVCSFHVVTNAANGVALMEGTGGTCTGGTPAGLAGGTTGATGWQFSANGGLSVGNAGISVMASGTTNYGLCIVTSATTQLSGNIGWVQL